MPCEWSKHDKTDAQYAGPQLRICAACPPGANVLALFKFPHDKVSDRYGVLCRRCTSEQRKFEQGEAAGEVLTTVANVISREKRRRKIGGYTYSEMIDDVLKSTGSGKRASRSMGKAIKIAIDRGTKLDAGHKDLDRAISASRVLLAATAEREKTKPLENEWDRLTESDKLSLLMDIAFEQIMLNKAFREKVLSIPDVRLELLKSIGTVIEVGADNKGTVQAKMSEEESWA